MNRLRFFLLVLLMVLLPLRGALGAVQACAGAARLVPEQGLSAPIALQHQAVAAFHAHHPGAMDHMDHMDHGEHATSVPQADQLPDPGCSDCIALCCLLPLPMATLPVLPALPAALACFAEPGVPAASFLCDGQERPPRS